MAYTPNTTPELQPLTLTYKVVQDVPICLDVYPPLFAVKRNGTAVNGTAVHLSGSDTRVSVPALVYFHGGGLTVGNRQSWFPRWMQKRVAASGYAFISADYRLMAPATGHDIVDDIKDVFSFVSNQLNPLLSQTSISGNNSDSEDHATFSQFHVDPNAIAVAGTSAGGLCAYYAAMHVSPKPKALLCVYAMGGDHLAPHYLTPKTVPFFRGREILDPALFTEYLYPFPDTLKLTTDSPLMYHPDSGYPANPRMFMSRLYLQLGTLLDYLTGEHNPSLSAALRESLGSDKRDLANSTGSDNHDAVDRRLKNLIPERHHGLFPQFSVTSDWPPTYFVHGSIDTAVLLHDSRHMHRLLEKAGVDVTLNVIEGEEHSFDYKAESEAVYGAELFDSVGQFLKVHLEKARTVDK